MSTDIMLHPARRDLLHVEVRVDDLLFIPHSLTHRLPDQGDNFPPVATVNSDVKSEFPLLFPLCYINPPVFTNSDKDKYKGAGHPVDVRFAPTVAKITRCPVDICSEPTVVERRAAAETKKYIKQYITKQKQHGKLIEIFMIFVTIPSLPSVPSVDETPGTCLIKKKDVPHRLKSSPGQ